MDKKNVESRENFFFLCLFPKRKMKNIRVCVRLCHTSNAVFVLFFFSSLRRIEDLCRNTSMHVTSMHASCQPESLFFVRALTISAEEVHGDHAHFSLSESQGFVLPLCLPISLLLSVFVSLSVALVFLLLSHSTPLFVSLSHSC